MIGQRYRVLGRLAAGAMGQVFVAEHLTLRKEVALKVVHDRFARNPEIAARFAREAQAGSRIDHPSVVAALDYGQLEEGGAYLVMRLARGERLGDLIERKGRLDWTTAAELGAQIADALGAAWAQGFVHRDLKPDNVVVGLKAGAPPFAQVLDFGVAGLAAPEPDSLSAIPVGPPLTKEGTIIGTPGYMAPEQALGQKATQAADLYSLGVILWEALVGEPMWTGGSARAIMRAQLGAPRPSPRAATGDRGIPAELDELVTRLVSGRPEQRPQSASQVRDDLRRVVAAHARPHPEQAPRRPEASRAGRLWALCAALALVVALAAAAVFAR